MENEPPVPEQPPDLGIQGILFERALQPEEIEKGMRFFYVEDYASRIEALKQKYADCIWYEEPTSPDSLSMVMIKDGPLFYFVFDINQREPTLH